MTSDNRKRCVAELVGTFGIVFAPVALAGAKSIPGSDGSVLAAALVSGLSVTAMIAAFGPLSGAHFNPAVTLGLASVRRFSGQLVLPYLAAQTGGALLAGAVCAMLFGPGYGAHVPAIPQIRAVVFEALLTAILLLVIMAMATDSRVDGALPPLSIGLTVVLCVLIGGAVTGGSINPARSLGPAVFNPSAFACWWIYALGPVIGAIVAARMYESVPDLRNRQPVRGVI